MSWRPRHILARLLLALSASMGCMNWECSPPQIMVPPHPAGSGSGGAAELSFTQAAQLCRSAGEELEKKGFTVEAVRQYENARKHDPQTPGVARHLAVLYDLQSNTTAAESEYRRAMQEQPRDADLLNDFGYFHYRHHRLQVAETWLRNALAVDPQCACACVNLGRVLADQGRVQESFQAFAQVLRPAEAYSNVGVLLAKQGRNTEARAALRQAVALDPGLDQPRAFLNALPSTLAPVPTDITRTAPPTPAPTPSVLPSPPPMLRSLPPISTPTSLPSPTPRTPPTVQVVASTQSAAPEVASLERPIIVNGPIRTAPPSPPPPAPLPLVLHKSVAKEDPILIRTSALLDEPRFREPSAPLPLPAMKPSIPLSPPLPPAPPQATLTDCQADAEPDSPSQPP